MKSLLVIFFLTFLAKWFTIFVSTCRSRLSKGQLSAVLPAGEKNVDNVETTTEKIYRTDARVCL